MKIQIIIHVFVRSWLDISFNVEKILSVFSDTLMILLVLDTQPPNFLILLVQLNVGTKHVLKIIVCLSINPSIHSSIVIYSKEHRNCVKLPEFAQLFINKKSSNISNSNITCLNIGGKWTNPWLKKNRCFYLLRMIMGVPLTCEIVLWDLFVGRGRGTGHYTGQIFSPSHSSLYPSITCFHSEDSLSG